MEKTCNNCKYGFYENISKTTPYYKLVCYIHERAYKRDCKDWEKRNERND